MEKWRESMATGVPGENEHRVRQANGEYRWFLARNAALRDENGHIIKWYVVLMDIENQKRTKARLLQALDEIKKLQNIVDQRDDNSPDAAGWSTSRSLCRFEMIDFGGDQRIADYNPRSG